MVEDAAALAVLAVDVLVEAAPRGIPPVALAALEALAHVVLHVVEERLCRQLRGPGLLGRPSFSKRNDPDSEEPHLRLIVLIQLFSTGVGLKVSPRFGEFCFCCCLPLLPEKLSQPGITFLRL